MNHLFRIIRAIICLNHYAHSFRPINRSQTYRKHTTFYSSFGRDNEATRSTSITINEWKNRRSFLRGTLQTLTLLGTIPTNVANARGLVRFPCKDPLLNTYHFMRAGTSLLERENVLSTNPLFLTNREAALSDYGEVQVRDACGYLISRDANPTVVRYSLAAAAVDSANIVGEELKIGRDRLVPEFNYMDPRAIGAWDFGAYNETMEAVWAMDETEAGVNGKGGRPPPNEDGTPAETLSDQVVRLTNLISVLETLYSGDSVLLIFPDGTGPALLSCLIGGIPLNKVHQLNYQPGEVRCNVNYQTVNLLASQLPPPAYHEIIIRGQDRLRYLREHPDEKRNIKDLKYEEEMKIEAENKKKADAKAKKEAEKKEQLAKQREMAAAKEYKASFDAQVGASAAAVIAGGIGIASITSASSDESDVMQLTESDVIGSKNQTQEAPFVADEDEAISSSVMTEEVESAMNAVAVQALRDEMATTSAMDVIRNELENGKKESIPSNEVEEASNIEFDYEDSWLSAITDILNEDELKNEQK